MKNKDDKHTIENVNFRALGELIDANKGKIFAAVAALFFVSCIIPIAVNKIDHKDIIYSDNTSTASTPYNIWEDDDSEKTLPESSSYTTMTSEDTQVTVKFPLDINIATVEELMMVKGIGEVLAQRIVDYRNINGYYYSLEDLLDVEGIGKKKLSSFNGYICIDYAELPETLPRFEETVKTEAPVNSELPDVTAVPEKKVSDEKKTSEVLSETDEEYDNIFEYDIYSEETITTAHYPDFPLELNSADASDLTYINGIGEATAEKIVEYARTVGFSSVDDLIYVKGIGRSKLEDIRPYVYVDPTSAGYAQITQPQYTFPFYEMTSGTDPTNSFSFTSETSVTQSVYMVNINSCSRSDLMQLPGITEETADKIIDLREQIGYFVRTEELAMVLSDAQLAKIMDYVYV